MQLKGFAKLKGGANQNRIFLCVCVHRTEPGKPYAVLK